MPTFSSTTSAPLTLDSSTESKVYGLFTLAMALTVVGVYFGMRAAPQLLNSGMYLILLFAELGIIFTARWWMNSSPLNYLLFGLFPLLSGFTITPYLLMVSTGYTNGNEIIFNAALSTTFMAGATALFAKTTSWNLGVMGRALFFGLIGLIILGILQLFIPAMRGTQFELLLSGGGVVIFALFLAYDIQRVSEQSKMGANPFMMALSLYLDIFNLFLYVLRFMTALSGNRR